MTFPLQVTFRNIEHSEAIDGVVRSKVDSLVAKFGDIVSCHVTVEAPSNHHRHGGQYHVTVDVGVPGSELVASRAPAEHHAHDDVYVAIRDAFRAIDRELGQESDKRHGRVKRQR